MLKKVTKFFITGVLAATVEYGVFIILHTTLNQVIILANSVSFLAGFIVSFLLNKHWVFKSKVGSSRELAGYTILAAVNLVVTNMIMYSLVSFFGVDAEIAKVLTMATVALWNYVFLSRLIFKGDK